MVELSTTRVFDVSDPVEAMEYNPQQCHLVVSSKHGHVSLYEVGRNGRFLLIATVCIGSKLLGTMVLLWTHPVDQEKTAYIAKSVHFYDGGRKVLIFVLESGEM